MNSTRTGRGKPRGRFGAMDGARTRGLRIHNPAFCRLNYHRRASPWPAFAHRDGECYASLQGFDRVTSWAARAGRGGRRGYPDGPPFPFPETERWSRRPDSNRGCGLCRPVPWPLGDGDLWALGRVPGVFGRADWTRTSGPSLPERVLCQAELQPVSIVLARRDKSGRFRPCRQGQVLRWCPRQESNLRSPAPQAGALSAEPRGRAWCPLRESNPRPAGS